MTNEAGLEFENMEKPDMTKLDEAIDRYGYVADKPEEDLCDSVEWYPVDEFMIREIVRAARAYRKSESVKEMMERLPGGSRVIREPLDRWWAVNVNGEVTTWFKSLEQALRAALDKCGVAAKASSLGADAPGEKK